MLYYIFAFLKKASKLYTQVKPTNGNRAPILFIKLIDLRHAVVQCYDDVATRRRVDTFVAPGLIATR